MAAKSIQYLLALCGTGFSLCAETQIPGQTAAHKLDAFRNVGIDQKLNSQLPLQLTFKDETGQTVTLGKYFTTKPAVLALVYYDCPMLCDMVLNGVVRAISEISLKPGKDFQIVTVSFNPSETWQLAASKKANYIEKLGHPEAAQGWHFLTGDDAAIRQLADAAGFRYNYNPETKQFAHAAGIMVATPEGKISRYYYGVSFPPRDIRFGLIEASNDKIGTPVDQVLLYCFHYDPVTGKYGMVIRNVIRVMGSLTVGALGILLFVLMRGEREKQHAA
jgi:protein SCO1/2